MNVQVINTPPEVKDNPPEVPSPENPVICRSHLSGNVVLFTSPTGGIYLYVAAGVQTVGQFYSDFARYDDTKHWERLPESECVQLRNDA